MTAVMFRNLVSVDTDGMAATELSGQSASNARKLAEQARQGSCAKVAVYRPFFICGILTVLTAGCMLGALALFGISLKGTYLASGWTPYVLAHANSQLYGWVGFFIIGFSLQHHAPTFSRRHLFHRLAWASLGLMSLGILLRFLADPMCQTGQRAWVTLGVVSASLQFLAVALFVLNTSVTRYRPKAVDGSNVVQLGAAPDPTKEQPNKPLSWPSLFVFFSLACFVVSAAAEPFAFYFSHQPDQTSSVLFVAEWFPPLRETQFLGFVASMIFGVGLAKFHECLGAPKAIAGLGIAGFVFWVAGLVARTVGWLQYFRSGMQAGSGWVYFLGGALLCTGAIFVVGSSGVFEKLSGQLRSHKFLKAAFAWLLIAGLMMLAEPILLNATGHPFSHAYTGAVRHALTVGFISQMIIAFSSRIVPNILGIEERTLPRLWLTFWLLNIGNAARVVLEVATDFTPNAFGPMGFTGFVELVGLVVWGVHMLKLLAQRQSTAVTSGVR